MNQTQTRSLRKKVLSLILAVVMVVSLLPISAFASGDSKASTTAATSDGYEYNIMFLDCGRKYYSVDSIKQIIDNASKAGFNYIQLAVGNDGLRFLLDDMSLTVNGVTYSTAEVTKAIQNGNTAYNKTFDDDKVKTEDTKKTCKYNPDTNELTQGEMDTIIAYANSKGMGVIPCVNTPGHMDAILSAASSLTNTTCSYNDSARTIDVTNNTAVAFTQALLQKYIDYFAEKGCQLFNMGADEYANDIYTSGSMGFGNLQSSDKYNYYVKYVNAVAKMIKDAGMKPMAFNDGIYFNNNTSSGTFDTDIIICYWSSGWPGYTPMSESALVKKGFKLINTNGSYYWVLGKTAKCSAAKAGGFDKTAFPGGTVSNPVGSMFCIWADYPGAETEESVISKTAATIAAFGKTLPAVKKVETVESKTVTKNNVTVTAPGLTDLTVAATDAPAIDAAAEGKVVAYDVTPATASGSYKKNGTVTLPIPEGWDASRVRGFVQNEDGSITTVIGVPADGKFTFTVPHFSVLGIYELAANAATETKTINLTVGGTTTDTIDGEYPGTKLDDAVASVVGGEPTDKPGTTTYEPATLGEGTFYVSTTANDTAPTVQLTFEDAGNEQYYIKDSAGKYVYPNATFEGIFIFGQWRYSVITTADKKDATVKVREGEDGSIVISRAVTGNGGTTAYLTLSGTPFGAGGNSKSLYLYSQKTTPGGKETTLTFTGKSAGTTTVTIGNVKYNITVTAEDLSKVTPLTIEYWITNRQVTANGGTNKKIKAADSTIYSETGAKFTDLVPATGTQDGNDVVFWKGTRLTSDNKQTDTAGVDKTKAGDSLTYIRYWNTKWSFSADGKTWEDFNSEDQIVAYYLQKTEVTSEITTNVVDWGQPYSEWVAGTDNRWFWDGYVENGSKYVFLDFAVVYEDNTQNPSSFPSDNTLFYHFDGCSESNPRILGAISFTENSDYEIWKVTVTDGTSTGYSSYETFTPTYDNKTETTVWDESMGGIPQIDQLQYIANRSGKLVRVYVRAKVTEDSLTVNYYDESNTTLPFYSYNIAVASGTTFNNDFAYSNGSLINNTVTNIKNVTQTVNWKLEEMSEIGAQYRYSDYTFTNANKETGNRVVNLYYKFKTEKTFVVDFGLPLHIEKTDINPALANANITEVAVGKSLYATINANADYSIDYILNKTIDGSDRVTVTYSGTNKDTGKDDSATYNLTVIPATSVYYEDSFATFTNVDGTKNVAQVDNAGKGIWTKVTDGTTQTNVNQALEELGGTTNTKNVYGYDPAYADSSKFSMGSATKVTVNANTANNGQWPTATFTFKGTGFDVISLTNSDSGTVVYTVTNKSTGASESHIINNYYGYRYDETTGKWVVENNDSTAPYQVPVIKVSGLDYDTYEVTISVIYGALFDNTGNHQYSFWLDAIRVYDPAGATLDTEYEKDHENAPNYVRIKQVILDSNALKTPGATGAVFIDGKGANGVTAADYTNQGPNHEAYLANRQAIAFQLIAKDKPTSVQIGAKLASGNSAGLKIGGAECAKANGGTLTLNTATDMYYELTNMDWQKDGEVYKSNVITLTNAGSGIISLTNLKFIGAKYTGSLPEVKSATSETNLVTLAVSSEMIDEALTTVDGALNPAPETFEPSHFEADWNRSVRAGQKATLTVKTSEDVDAITVDGQTITTYRTRTERTGWGWWSPRVTYRVFTYTTTAQATADYEVCALNSSGVASEPITATLTVKPAINWWHKWF